MHFWYCPPNIGSVFQNLIKYLQDRTRLHQHGEKGSVSPMSHSKEWLFERDTQKYIRGPGSIHSQALASSTFPLPSTNEPSSVGDSSPVDAPAWFLEIHTSNPEKLESILSPEMPREVAPLPNITQQVIGRARWRSRIQDCGYWTSCPPPLPLHPHRL